MISQHILNKFFFKKSSKSKFFKSTGCLEFRNAVSQGFLTAKPKEKQASKAPTFERLCLGKSSTTPFSLVFEDKPKGRKGSVVQGTKLQAGGQLLCASISPCPVWAGSPTREQGAVSQSLPELKNGSELPFPSQICLPCSYSSCARSCIL